MLEKQIEIEKDTMKRSSIVQRLHVQHNNFFKNVWSKTSLGVGGGGSNDTRCPAPAVGNSEQSGRNQEHCALRVERYYKEVVSMDLVLQCCVNTVMSISPPRKIVVSASSKRMIQDRKELVVGLSALKSFLVKKAKKRELENQ